MLNKEHDQLLDELDVVKWYIQVFEEGRDTKDLLKQFVQAQE